MKKAFVTRITSLMLALVLMITVFSGVFTVSAECSHNYTYTLTKTPSESADGSRHGVCTLCGDETTEVIEGVLTDINYAPEADYNYGTTHDVVGAVLPDQPAPDTAVDFVKNLGGKEGNAEGNALHNTTVLSSYLASQKAAHASSLVEVVTHIKFPEGDFYFNSIRVDISYDEAWVYHGRFTFDGVKEKTRIVMNDASGGSYGLFTNPTNTYSMMYTTFTDIEFTTATYLETGKPSKTINFIDGGKKSNGTSNLPMNLYQFKAINCVISGFNSVFTGCTSITGPYISNSDFVDFGDAFFQGCGLVDMKVTNNVIRGFGYETDAGYEPSYFQAQSDYCSGIISNNKLYNMQFDGDNRDGRFAYTGEVVTPFANNYCERVYGVSGIQTVTGNDFTKCSKQDMIDFLETKGTVSKAYLDQVVSVIIMPAVANRFSSDDMTGTYLVSSSCKELLDNAYNFGKIAPDHLYYANSVAVNGNDVNIDLSMFPLKYVKPGLFPSGTHLNLNGKSVYSRFRKANSGNASFNSTTLFDEYGNDIGYIAEDVPTASDWDVKASGTYSVLSDGRLHIKTCSALSNTAIASFTLNDVDACAYRRYFVDNSKIELIAGDYTKILYSVSFVNSSGAALASVPVTPENAGYCPYVATGISGKTEPVMGKMIVTLQITSPKTSETNPLELIIPPIEIEKYSGMSTGEAQTLHTFKTGTDYSVVGADYDELYAEANEVSGFASPETVEKVYFNETYGHLRTITVNGTAVKNDTYALQTALNDIKDTNKELVIEEGSYNLMYNMSLAKHGYKTGSLYFEGGHTYRIRALGEVSFSFKSDMDSGAFFYQKGEGEVSGYMINIDTGKPFENVERGAVFHEINFKNFVIDNCTLCGAYSLFYNCTFDSSIYQNGYVAKSNKIFNNSTVTNSCIINNYVHIGWVSAEGVGQENQMDAGWLFYDSAFLNSTFQDNWSEYIRFNNGGWYEQNDYAPSNSLFTGNILDYTVEIRLGYGDIAIGNGNYHCSKWDLMYNDKNVSNMTYEIVNRSVGTYHISSGVTVIGNSFTGTATVSPAIYFDGSTNAWNADGTKAIKNATVFGNNYTYGINKFDEENGMFAVEGEIAETVPSLDVDIENSLYKKLDAEGSTGNYFDFAQVNFHAVPHYWMPGTIVQSGDVMGVLGYNAESGKVEVLTPSGAATGLKPLSADMLEGFEPVAYYNNGNATWPKITLKDGDYELKQGVDYAISASNTNIRTDAILRIEGMGKYYGTIKSYYTIQKAPLELANVKLSFDTAEYDGTDKKPTVLFAYYNHADVSGQYSVSYSEHTALGTSYVILTANADSTYFTGSKRVAYTVEGGDVVLEKQQTVTSTCEEEGYTTYLCPHCSEVITTDYTEPTGHKMEVSDKKDATCTGEGYVKYTCANGCGETLHETIEAVSHVNRFYNIPATCIEGGVSGRKCILCGGNDVISETFDALGHAATYEKIIDGNCKTAGKLQHICEACGEVVTQDTFDLNPNAHVWEVETLKTAPTCTEDGVADATCSICGTFSENAAIPAAGHTAGDTTVSGAERNTNCVICGKVCGKEYLYEWDFTDEENGAADAKELEELTEIGVNNAENYYNSSMGSYLIPFVSSSTTSAVVFGTPSGSVPKSFDITTKGDPYGNCVSVPGVIFAHDENGVYSYSVYMNASSSVTEVVYYIPYVKTSGEVTGFGSPWLLMEQQGSLAKIYEETDGRLNEITDIYSTYGFKPGAAEAKYATYDYHVTVSGSTVSIYADIHFNFNLVENSDAVKFDLVTERKTLSLESITLNAPKFYNTNFYTKTDVTHDEFEFVFGVYQYTRDAVNSAYQQGLGEIKGATLNYTVAIDCKHAKTYKTGAIAPTCLKDGKEADTVCADCGYIISSGELIKPLGHDEQVETVEPTCTELGSATTTCSRCDYYSFVNLPATGHNLSEYELTTPATCEANGVETSVCANCGKVVNRYIKSFGHSYENWAITKEPTASANGEKKATCTVCGKVNTKTMLSGQYVEYDWDYSDKVSGKNYVEETAAKAMLVDTSKGSLSGPDYRYYNEKTRTYDIKSASSNTQMTILNPGEGYSASSFTLSAYTESFSTYYTTPGIIVAEDDNYYYYLQIYFMQKSLYYNIRGIKKSAITATSTDGIYSVLTSTMSKNKSAVAIKAASVNGTKLASADQTNNIIKLIGEENLTEYTTSDGSTVAYALPLTFNYSYVIQDGRRLLSTTLEYYKESTGETISVALTQLYITPYNIGLASTNAITPAFGYIVNSSGTPFDCYLTENTGICKINSVNAVYTAGEGAHIHSYTAGETAEATCENSGYTLYSCSCGDSYKLAGAAALGHDETVERTEPTCTKAGKLNVTCSRCDYVVDETLSSLGHDYLYEVIDATCAKAGRKITTCTRCDYSRTLVIPKLSHKYETVTVEPTCTEVGTVTETCTLCGTSTVEETAATGHTESDWITDKEATATQDGSRHTECTVCGTVMQTETIPATGPNLPFGDANGDGVLTINDAVMIARYASNIGELSEEGMLVADVDGSGKVDVLDAVLIAKHTTGLIDKFPIEE